ncbi:hypothetical protein AURDEDRAFT_160360 [Auricularia subglabra TFB-10046 SS5]|nr:hypothetical protein AURDEDRAFT_160360 [Auricularia subglabra TFB-10046 SS5]
MCPSVNHLVIGVIDVLVAELCAIRRLGVDVRDLFSELFFSPAVIDLLFYDTGDSAYYVRIARHCNEIDPTWWNGTGSWAMLSMPYPTRELSPELRFSVSGIVYRTQPRLSQPPRLPAELFSGTCVWSSDDDRE